ncbi:MAG: fructose-6-phosphate aldolase [Candidatus Tectomicrobia bacterium]|nr:fructose-6-phosphate aldolase [Candidatus Tectomicrobia bacterium]
MKFFLDTANIEEIREGVALGIIDGVTTNPTLIAREGKDYRKALEEVCEIVEGPVSAEVLSEDFEGMLVEGRDLARLADNIVVKVPMGAQGLKATRRFSEEGVPVNVTLCFSATQALMAAKAGASYISPFVGRLDDISQEGMRLVEDILAIYDNYGFETEVLVASIRHPVHVLQAALAGADVATMPFAVLKQLLQHPLTDKGLKKFLQDWQAAQRNFLTEER